MAAGSLPTRARRSSSPIIGPCQVSVFASDQQSAYIHVLQSRLYILERSERDEEQLKRLAPASHAQGSHHGLTEEMNDDAASIRTYLINGRKAHCTAIIVGFHFAVSLQWLREVVQYAATNT